MEDKQVVRMVQNNGPAIGPVGTSRLRAGVYQITPAMAREWLERNPTAQRGLRQRVVRDYAAAMRRGEWALTGQAITFTQDGTLLDGQHRLHAVVESGVTIENLVVVGVDAQEAMPATDVGRKRTLADALAIKGHANTTTLAAALLRVRAFYAGPTHIRFPSSQQLTHLGGLKLAQEHPGLSDMIHRVEGRQFRKLCPARSWFIAFAHVLDQEVGGPMVDSFITGVVTGSGLGPKDARLALREKFMAVQMEKRRTTPPVVLVNFMIQAWNAWYEHRPLTVLRPPPVPEGESMPIYRVSGWTNAPW